MMRDGWMTYVWPGMWVGHAVWIVLLAGLIWILVDRLRPYEAERRSPMLLLDERFARGEIDQTEYEARRKVLLR